MEEAGEEHASSKERPVSAGDERNAGPIPGSGRSSGVENGNPFQYSRLENPMGRRVWRAPVHGVAKRCSCLKRLSIHARGGGAGLGGESRGWFGQTPVDRHLDVWLWSSGSSGQAVNLGACTTVALTPLNMEETTLKVLRNKGKWPRTAPGVGSAAGSPRGNMWAKGPRKCAPSPTPVPGCYILSPAPALWHSTLTACPPRLCSILRWFRGPALPVGVSALRTVALSILILPELCCL